MNILYQNLSDQLSYTDIWTYLQCIVISLKAFPSVLLPLEIYHTGVVCGSMNNIDFHTCY